MTDTQKTNPQNERLVAYLDGELSAPQSEAVEEQLANDAELRDELSQLDRVWNLLDLAPRTTVGPVFSESTVAMVTMEAERDVAAQTIALPATKQRRGLITVLTTLAAAMVAFLVVRGIASRADRQLITNLPVIQQAAVLSQVDSLDFLRRVRDEVPRLAEAIQGLDLEQEAETWELLVEATIRERAQWIGKLPSEEREGLAAKAIAFRALSPHNDRQLHDLDQELTAAEDGPELRRTALAYHTLISTRSAGEQAALRSLPPEERISELHRKARPWSEQALLKLSNSEQAHFREVVLELASTPSVKSVNKKIIERLLDNQEPRRPGPWRQIAKRLRDHPEGIFLFTAGVMAREGRGPKHSSDSPQFEKLKQLWPVWESQLATGLPERLQVWMKNLPPPHRAKLLSSQLIASAGPINPGDAKQFFTELSNDEQQALLALPVAKMQQHLREQMAEEQLGLRGAKQFENMWRSGFNRRGPPRHGPGRHGPNLPRGGRPSGPPPGQRPSR